MRRLFLAYGLVAVWVFGWMTGVMGIWRALVPSVIFSLPVWLAWRLTKDGRTSDSGKPYYFAAVAIVASVATAYIAVEWYRRGMDKLAMFERECDEFHDYVASRSEYQSVNVSYTLRKGGRVYLHGEVKSKEAYDRLIHKIESTIRNNRSGYFDGVDYPGKPAERTPEPQTSSHGRNRWSPGFSRSGVGAELKTASRRYSNSENATRIRSLISTPFPNAG